MDSLSRLTKVQELRKKISEMFHVEPQLQRLFYRGKQVKWLSIHPLIFVPGNLPPPPPLLVASDAGGKGEQRLVSVLQNFLPF